MTERSHNHKGYSFDKSEWRRNPPTKFGLLEENIKNVAYRSDTRSHYAYSFQTNETSSTIPKTCLQALILVATTEVSSDNNRISY